MLLRAIAAAGLFCSFAAGQDPRDGGPLALVITYRCNPGMRTELRQHMLNTGIARLQHWREEGDLKDYHVLFSRYVDTDSWDMMTILSFANYSELEKWKRVERAAPAGLDNATLAITIGVATYPADLIMRNGAEAQPPEPVYLVIPYIVSAPAPEYLNYLENYVRPQFEGFMQEGFSADMKFMCSATVWRAHGTVSWCSNTRTMPASVYARRQSPACGLG